LVNYEDFVNWKQDPVTKQFFNQIEDKIEEVKDLLVQDAGKDPEGDRYLCGYARACYDILATEFKEDD